MDRKEATRRIMEAKGKLDVTFEELSRKVDRHKVWTTAALMGQHPMSAGESAAIVEALGLGGEVAGALQEIPMRGALDHEVPADPTIYRIHEVTQVYGPTIKALIHEEFGDGIMSAINFRLDLEREEDPEGDRVKITYSGKFLPYQW
jgi:cyanate lyase